ncbi:hypothetical protein BVX94_00715, partial [bacterium B17]
IIMFFSSLFQVLATVAIVTLDLGFCAIFVVMVITALVRFSFGLGIMLRSFIVPTFGFTKSDFWRFVRESSIVGLGVFLYLNLFRINTILLDWIHGSEETAYYQSVYNLVIQLQVIPTVLTVAMFPGLARRFTDPKALKDVLCSRMIRYFAIFGVTISWPLFCLSGEIVAILGEKYAYSAIPLRILAWTCIGLFVDMACNNILVAAGKQSLTLLTVIIAMIINLCIAYFLIPAFGSAGAAMTALATDISLLIISTGIVLWWCKGLPKLLSCFGGLAISTAAALATTLILCKELNPFLAVIVGGIVYLTIIMLTGTISIKEVKEILYTRKGPTEIKASKPSKVLLIGWDGATFDILSP